MNRLTLTAALALALAAPAALSAPPPIFGAVREPARMTWPGAQGFNLTDYDYRPSAPDRARAPRPNTIHHPHEIHIYLYDDHQDQHATSPAPPPAPLYCRWCYNN